MGSKKIQKIMIILIFLTLSIVCYPSVTSDDYYADIDISVDNSGFVTIEGVTNHQDLLAQDTEIYTSKQQSLWLLNITKKEFFSDFIFKLTLPKNSEINYVKSSGSISISEELGNLIIKGFGENESLSLIVQYKTDKTIDGGIFGLDVFSFILLVSIVVLIILFFVVLIFMDKQKKTISNKATKKDGGEISLRGLNERQKKIIKLLVEHKRAFTQTEIQRELNIPKASVSRNIRSLEIKGLVEKEQIGMSNLIRLKKS